MKPSCPIANVSPSKSTNPAVFDRRAEGYYFDNVTLGLRLAALVPEGVFSG